MKTKRKLLALLLGLIAAGCLILAACGGSSGPKITLPDDRYDVGTGGDLTLTVDFNGGSFQSLKDNGQIVDGTNYLLDQSGGKLTVLGVYLQYLELGTHTFTMTTDKGSTDFKLELINAVSTSFDTSVKSYVYGSGTGIAIPADFSTATVTSLRIGTTRVDAQFYDYADGSFILKPALCESLYGTTNFTLLLSNNDSYQFQVMSDCLFNANFELGLIPADWYNVVNPTIAQGWDGNAMRYTGYGSGGNLFIFHNKGEELGFGLGMPFEEGKIYCLSFDVKNLWDEDFAPFGTIGLSNMYADGSAGVFLFNYTSGELRGGTCRYDAETEVYRFKIYLDAPVEGQFMNAYCGYDPDHPTQKMCDLLFDNIVLTEAGTMEPVLSESSVTYPSGSRQDVWISGEFGSARIASVAVKGGAALAADAYVAYPSTLGLKGEYLEKNISGDTVFEITLDTGSKVEFTVKAGLSKPTSFTEDNNRNFEFGSEKDLVFSADFGSFAVKELLLGDTVVPADCYAADSSSFTLKAAYLNRLTGSNSFTIVVDNAGRVEGKTEDETHTFTVTTNALYFEDCETDGFDTGFKGTAAAGFTVTDAGVDGKSARFASTGGHFMTFGPEGAAWQHGHTRVALADGTLYRLQFDIKELAATPAQIEFYLHGSVDAAFTMAGGLAVIKTDAGVLKIVQRSETVSTIVFTFRYSADLWTGNGVVALEASGYNEYYYDLAIDNIVLYEVNLGTAKTYVYGSGQDVSYNVDFSELRSLTANGVALAPESYTLAGGVLTLKADWCQTVVGEVSLEATLSDDSKVPFVLRSTRLYFNDFEGQAPDTSFLAYTAAPAVGESWTGEGKALYVKGNGGEILVFGNGWEHPYAAAPFEKGKTYQFSFDMKLVDADNPTQTTFQMAGTLFNSVIALNLDFNAGTFHNNNSAVSLDGTTYDADSRSFHVVMTFTVGREGVTDGFPGYVDGATGIVYSWAFDNISILQLAD